MGVSMNKVGAIASAVGLAVAALIASTQVTLFVIQPIGAVPEGRTLVISRLTSLRFIDSADAWCERRFAKVNLLCRGAVIARVAEEANILLRLPYSETLYLWSTGGATYGR
jgi:hypothetical protein